MLLLLVGIVLICLRVFFASSRAMLNVAYPEGSKKHNKKNLGQSVAKGATRAKKVASGSAAVAAYGVEKYSPVIKRTVSGVTKFLDFLIMLWAVGMAALVAFMLVLALLLGSVVGGIWSGAIDIGDIGSISKGGGDDGGGDSKKDDDDSKDSGGGGGGSTEVPKNMDEKEWKRADDIGQKFASTAIESSIMPFPGSSGDTNNGHLVYQQGNTPIGYYDCSTFVSAVYEANGVTHSGKKVKKPYDFKTMKKSNLKEYLTAGGTKSFIKSNHKDAIITKMDASGWKDKIVPGDVMVSGSHIVVYVGKNKDGKQIIAHAGSSTSKVFYDVMLTKNGKQVGIAPLSNWMTSAGEVVIYRPSKVVK